MDGRVVPLSLWLLTIAESGERKSAVDGEAMRAVREIERALATKYEDALKEHSAELAEWTVRKEHASSEARKRGGADLADALLALGVEPPPPLKPMIVAADFTAEGLAKLLLAGRPSIGAFTDEAGLVFGGHGMTKETVVRTAATLSRLWDRGELDRVRATEGATKLWGRRLALHLMAQPVIAERALSDDVLAGQGFLARCLMAWPNGTAGTRAYTPEPVRDDASMRAFSQRIAELLRRDFQLVDGARNELAPRALRLTADAAWEWRNVHDAIERAEAPGGRYAACKPWASKAGEQCLRIAGVLRLVEEPDAEVIDADSIRRAAELTVWYLNEAARLAGASQVSPEVHDAEALLAWCHATARAMLYSTVALSRGPARIRENAAFCRAMAELEATGWAHPIEGGAIIDGRHRKRVWTIVPAEDA
jgi:hypothetical protein